MLNSIILIGRMTRDIEVRPLQSGKLVGNFTLAVDRDYKKDETDFILCVVWEKLASLCEQYTGKGSLVAVKGRLQVRNYEDNDGKRRTIAEVVADNVRFLEPKKDRQAQQSGGQAPEDFFEGEVVDDDDVPF